MSARRIFNPVTEGLQNNSNTQSATSPTFENFFTDGLDQTNSEFSQMINQPVGLSISVSGQSTSSTSTEPPTPLVSPLPFSPSSSPQTSGTINTFPSSLSTSPDSSMPEVASTLEIASSDTPTPPVSPLPFSPLSSTQTARIVSGFSNLSSSSGSSTQGTSLFNNPSREAQGPINGGRGFQRRSSGSATLFGSSGSTTRCDEEQKATANALPAIIPLHFNLDFLEIFKTSEENDTDKDLSRTVPQF